MSEPVITAITPGICIAFVGSMARMRAWAWGLRRILACSMRGSDRSSV